MGGEEHGERRRKPGAQRAGNIPPICGGKATNVKVINRAENVLCYLQ